MNHFPKVPILTTQVLLDRGYSKRFIANEVKTKKLLPLRRGIYVETVSWKNLYPAEQHLVQMQALGAMGSFVFTHESAALALDLPVLTVPGDVQVLALPKSRGRVAGVQKHYRQEAPTTVPLDGLHITAPLQTLVDCAKTLPLADALCLADGALYRGLTSSTDLSAALLEASGRGVRNCRRVAKLMSGLAESPGETLTRLALIQAGIGFTEQYWVRTDSQTFRTDFAIDGFMLIVEFDGDIKYREKAGRAVLEERKRERILQNQGWTFVRLTWQDVQVPGRVQQLVQDGMSRALPRSTSYTPKY